jgi:hypothetical protein
MQGSASRCHTNAAHPKQEQQGRTTMKPKILIAIAGLSLATAGFAGGAQADPWHDQDHRNGDMHQDRGDRHDHDRGDWHRHDDGDGWRHHHRWHHHCRIVWRHHHRVEICP